MKADILIVGQTPPPCHGQAVVTGMLFEHDWSKVRVALLRMGYSDSIDAVGRFSFSKIFHLIYLVSMTWRIWLKQGVTSLYYLPASPHTVPILRDVIYLLMTRFLFKRVIFHYHAGGLVEYLEKKPLLGWLARGVYSGADMSIELSASGVSPSSYFRAKKSIVIPNGLDVGDVKVSKPQERKTWQVVFIGSLVEGKGIGQIVETARLMRDSGEDVHFTVIGGWGDVGYRDVILAEIKVNGLQDLIEFPGILSGQDKWNKLASADCFFFPTHYASESFPLVLIEAMAYGLPIVSTDWRGIPALVADSGAAMLYPIKSASHYASAIAQIKNDASLAGRMSSAGIEFYQNNYTKACFLKRMEDVFDEVLTSVSVDKSH